jgi:hypothetical protein
VRKKTTDSRNIGDIKAKIFVFSAGGLWPGAEKTNLILFLGGLSHLGGSIRS